MRTLLVFLLLLVGGAAVNVAVAWEIASHSPGKVPLITRDRRDGGADYVLSDDATFETGYFGSPCKAMTCSYHSLDEVHDGIHLNTVDGHFVYALPVLPLWPGFAINTVFYAAILWAGWLLLATPFALRRRRRIARDLCPACAYPVGTSAVCTECGTAVPVKATAQKAPIG